MNQEQDGIEPSISHLDNTISSP